VLVQNGLEMEEFLEDLVKNASSPNLKIIDSAKELLRSQLKKLKGMIMTIRKVRNRLKRGTVMIMANSTHIWLDPKRAIQQVENIRDGLIAADPQGKRFTRRTQRRMLRNCENSTAKLPQRQPYAGKTFVAFHDFAPYFAESYNLKAEFLVDIPKSGTGRREAHHGYRSVH